MAYPAAASPAALADPGGNSAIGFRGLSMWHLGAKTLMSGSLTPALYHHAHCVEFGSWVPACLSIPRPRSAGCRDHQRGQRCLRTNLPALAELPPRQVCSVNAAVVVHAVSARVRGHCHGPATPEGERPRAASALATWWRPTTSAPTASPSVTRKDARRHRATTCRHACSRPRNVRRQTEPWPSTFGSSDDRDRPGGPLELAFAAPQRPQNHRNGVAHAQLDGHVGANRQVMAGPEAHLATRCVVCRPAAPPRPQRQPGRP